MNISKIIATRRKQLNLTLEEIGNIVGVSKSTVKKWENGFISNMRRDKISLLAKALQLDPVTLITGQEVDFANNIVPPPQLIPKPRLGAIACGTPILAEENHETTDFVPADIKCDFTLECKGDSMIDARILDGDIVYIRSQPSVENGEIAAVLVNSNEATLKRVFFYTNKVMLQPANPNYEPLVFVNEEINQIKIIGKAVGFTSKLK